WKPIYEASKRGGVILVAGLGLGVVTSAILRECENVTQVIVIEKSSEVIELVGKHLEKEFGKRLQIINDDIFEWKVPRGSRYTVAWFDIWNNICGDNTKDMSKLKRKFGRKADWKGCWREETCRDANRR
ncbi:unnamed protein product, partial [marine sediment metagenome]